MSRQKGDIMREVLISIQAEHNANIESGRKTEELRTRVPKCELPIKFYTYESGKNGRHKVTNEWICREIREYPNANDYPYSLQNRACVPMSYICDYTKDGEKLLHGLVITDLVVYDEPRELSDFEKPCICKGEYEGEQYCDCLNCDLAGDSDYGIIACDIKLKRPFQSWGYVVATEPRQTAD